MNVPAPPEFEVFFDQQCPMCRREIDMVRRKDKHNRLKLTDISSPQFSQGAQSPTLETLMRSIHGRFLSGPRKNEWVQGVEVFREIYSRLGFGGLVSISRWPLLRSLLAAGYKVFAYIRYLTAVRRIRRDGGGDGSDCTPEHCSNFPADDKKMPQESERSRV
ncbi:MAG: DUF393 domain-containing protein [Mariniblastus sp.]|nr:DUF393 domain-containing protein [Mariniblastus sp.]